ncbi:type II toxin-antitoxin system VapC family toxin [Lewinella sp. IMCC34183]|uniref:type II toxin-antitoxin system VapC family toxin n=1 Tax=Lewinella sp. IMCC34183 TaxID=2248762 RepID=UPI000E248848|nr:PIN domain-containing protein [Lewinella sp. IMCC34183]
MEVSKILLDTSFLIRVLDPNDPDHANFRRYLEFFLRKSDIIYLSTIVAAEYGVMDSIHHLPLALSKIRILPFNLDHATKASEFGRASYDARRKGVVQVGKRVIIPNDTKLLAQAEVERVNLFIGRDDNCQAVHRFLKTSELVNFEYQDARIPFNEFTGELF